MADRGPKAARSRSAMRCLIPDRAVPSKLDRRLKSCTPSCAACLSVNSPFVDLGPQRTLSAPEEEIFTLFGCCQPAESRPRRGGLGDPPGIRLRVLELIRKLREEWSAGLQTGCTGGVHAASRRLWVWRPTGQPTWGSGLPAAPASGTYLGSMLRVAGSVPRSANGPGNLSPVTRWPKRSVSIPL